MATSVPPKSRAAARSSATTRAPLSPAAAGDGHLTDAQLVELLGILRGVDSVELKLTVPTDAHRSTIQVLPVDPIEAQPRQIYFFDTPDLTLFHAGVVVRARRIQGGRGDTVIKLRPVVPEELPTEIRRNVSFNVEVDVLPGGFVCSGSFKGRSTASEVADAVAGKIALRKIYSKEQRAFFAAHAPDGITLDSLSVLGPTFILKTAFPLPDLKVSGDLKRLVAEVWLYPDGSRILELSTRCLASQAFQVAAELRAYLGSHGVPVSGVQQTKTRVALEFYRAQLARQ